VTDPATLTIREVAGRTGVPAATLRMWETRHGFPAPTRLASGHRRYSDADCLAIERVLAERERGLSLQAAVDRVLSTPLDGEPSLFAALRAAQPALSPQVLSKRALTALSRAIEDEILARADRPVLFAAFQRERFYRASERRWRELARTAELTIALADFERARVRSRGVCELPLPGDAPLRREWALVCDGERLCVALAAWELTSEVAVPDAARRFETVWTVEPAAVRRVAARAAELAARIDPELVGSLDDHAGARPSGLADAMALMNRCIAYVAAAAP
jgi:DICT domain-containing protein